MAKDLQKGYHHENLREALIEAGIRLINEVGFAQLSLRKIAAECGVSHAAPYRHFQDKEKLLSAMQQHVESQFSAILRASVGDGRSPHCMLAFGKAYVQFFVEHPQYYQFFVTQKEVHVCFSEENSLMESNYAPFHIFREQAENHLASGGVPKEMWVTAAAGMWAMVHGMAGLATMPGVNYSGNWAELTEKILKGLTLHE